jgi:hypothetical protein
MAGTQAFTRSRPSLDAISFVLYGVLLVSPLAATYLLLQIIFAVIP